ncbi:helix-turn-helix transcriptional regulator [Lentzea indica]|uniref:helix-turn-helix transcriptional regulator n=1 Tax=Lentzea indica TaxID=2604800 RepID=UPI00143B903C|nr:LuxR C-terminal-related transcriptional regulator [Lentzea indica]
MTVDEGLSLLEGDPANAVLGDLVHTAGAIALQQGDPDRATAHFTVALTAGNDMARVDALEGMGVAAVLLSRPQRAVRLLASAMAARDAVGWVGEPWWSGQCASALSTACAELSPATADALLADGAGLTVDQAITCALEDQDSPSVLTPREWEVAGLVADGLTNREIAARQGVSARTVASHLENVRAKLDLPTRAHITAWVTRIRLESSHTLRNP